MKPISYEDVGNPIYLSSTFGKGRYVTYLQNESRYPVYEKPTYSPSQVWVLQTSNTPGNGFQIVASDGSLIGSTPGNETIVSMYGNAHLLGHSGSQNPCLWYLGRKGSIYQPRGGGGDRYLWMVNGVMMIALDGFLAERWLSEPVQ